MQQLREAFPFESAPRHLIFDRDSLFCPAVVEFVKALGAEPSRTAYRSPWQNPVAERWNGSLRSEVLDDDVVLCKQRVIRLFKSYIRYYHEDRCPSGSNCNAATTQTGRSRF
jgi:putative transposase